MSSADDACGLSNHAADHVLSASEENLMDRLLESPSERSMACVLAYAREQLKIRNQHDA